MSKTYELTERQLRIIQALLKELDHTYESADCTEEEWDDLLGLYKVFSD